jgi:hypothetical protein
LLGPICGRTGSLLGIVSNVVGVLYLNYQQDGIIPSKKDYEKMLNWLKIGIADFIAKENLIPAFVTSNYYKLLYKYAQEYASGKEQNELIKMAVEWAQISLTEDIPQDMSKQISENIVRMRRGEPYKTIRG